jgi:beta-phosphoglucomutase-like phosphatase (HAD superfamily)
MPGAASGLKLGSCSGYPRPVMEKLVPAAAAQGYAPDHWVATDDLAVGGRPGPWMALQNVITLGIENAAIVSTTPAIGAEKSTTLAICSGINAA